MVTFKTLVHPITKMKVLFMPTGESAMTDLLHSSSLVQDYSFDEHGAVIRQLTD